MVTLCKVPRLCIIIKEGSKGFWIVFGGYIALEGRKNSSLFIISDIDSSEPTLFYVLWVKLKRKIMETA
jgi:hypothetical protein